MEYSIATRMSSDATGVSRGHVTRRCGCDFRPPRSPETLGAKARTAMKAQCSSRVRIVESKAYLLQADNTTHP